MNIHVDIDIYFDIAINIIILVIATMAIIYCVNYYCDINRNLTITFNLYLYL